MNAEPSASTLFLSHDWEPEPLPVAEVRRGYSKHKDEATIAHDLHKLADSHVKAGTVLSVVGNDLPNVADDDYPWATEYLPDWGDRGARVRYLALDPSPEARTRLHQLTAAFDGRFEARVLKKTAFTDPEAAPLAKQWRTFHFAVFENEPQLWVEMNHPPGQTKAHDCYYFAPNRATGLPLHATCLRRFNWMFTEHAEPLA